MSVNNSLDSVLDMSVQKLYGPWNNSFFKEKTNLFLDSVLVLGPNNVYNFYKFSLHEREIVLYLKRNSFLYVWTWNQKFFNTHMNENNCVQQTKLCYNAENNPLNMTTNHNYWCYKSMKTMIQWQLHPSTTAGTEKFKEKSSRNTTTSNGGTPCAYKNELLQEHSTIIQWNIPKILVQW